MQDSEWLETSPDMFTETQRAQSELVASATNAMFSELMGELTAALDGHDNVGEVRGRGLMAAVELVSNRTSREPLSVARAVSDIALRKGLLLSPGGHHGNVLGFLPPLIVSPEQLTTCAAIVRDVLQEPELTAL